MKVLAIPDIHLPFTNWVKLQAVAKLALRLNVDRIVQLGDIIDGYSWSRFEKEVSHDAPDIEYKRVCENMKKMHRLFPEMDILVGNHDHRMIKSAKIGRLPTKHQNMIAPWNEFDFEGWAWHHKPLEIDKVVYMHGDFAPMKAIDKAKLLGKSVVQGHTHQCYIEFVETLGHSVFGAEAGCLIDTSSVAFSYHKGLRKAVADKCMLIDNGHPMIISV